MIRSNRTLVALVALVAIGLSVSAAGAAAAGPAGQPAGSADVAQVSNSSAVDAEALSLDAYNDGTYTVVQGDRCVPIEPLGDGYQTAEQYYDYRHPETSPSSYMYSSHGTTHLQESNASRFFLHDGGNGLSLMLVHGELEGTGDGGSTTMVFDDLPAEGEWTVTDDQYDLENGSSDDVWDTRADASRISWAWSEGRTDGGAYTGLGDDFAITIQPHFNGAADLQLYDGTVEDWQVLSGDERNPRVASFDMDEPIELRTGTCAAVTDVEIGETSDNSTTIEAVVTNDGTAEETVTVPIAIDGDVVDEREVTIGSNEAVTLDASVELRDAAAVSVGGQVARVSDDADTDGDGFAEGLPGFGVLVALVAIATALVVGRRR